MYLFLHASDVAICIKTQRIGVLAVHRGKTLEYYLAILLLRRQ